MNEKKFINFIKKYYNDIFKEPNLKIENELYWYENIYGSFGAQNIIYDNNFFHISIVVNDKFKVIKFSFDELLAKVYLYNKYFLENKFLLSFNQGKIHKDMISSKVCDGYYIILNKKNKPEIENYLNKKFTLENINLENCLILETFT